MRKSWAAHVKGGPSAAFVHNPGLLLGVAAVPVPVLILATLAVMGIFIAVIGRGSTTSPTRNWLRLPMTTRSRSASPLTTSTRRVPSRPRVTRFCCTRFWLWMPA